MTDRAASGLDWNDGPSEVLHVEDNPGDVRLVREAFDTADVDVELRIEVDGVKAIEALSRRRNGSESLPAFVLLDLNSPRMDGIDVLEAIRDDPELAHLPILVLTSSTDDEDIAQCYGAAANAVLTKPVAPDDLRSLVATIQAFWIENAKLPTVEMRSG